MQLMYIRLASAPDLVEVEVERRDSLVFHNALSRIGGVI